MKRLLYVILLVTLLCITMTGCFKQRVSENVIKEDFIDHLEIANQDNYEIEDFEIDKRKYDKEEDKIYITAEVENDETVAEVEFILIYEYYDRGGWKLEDYELEDYEIEPISEVDSGQVESDLFSYNVLTEELGSKVMEVEILEVGEIESNDACSALCQLSISNNYLKATSIIEVFYIFKNYQWQLDGISNLEETIWELEMLSINEGDYICSETFLDLRSYSISGWGVTENGYDDYDQTVGTQEWDSDNQLFKVNLICEIDNEYYTAISDMDVFYKPIFAVSLDNNCYDFVLNYGMDHYFENSLETGSKYNLIGLWEGKEVSLSHYRDYDYATICLYDDMTYAYENEISSTNDDFSGNYLFGVDGISFTGEWSYDQFSGTLEGRLTSQGLLVTKKYSDGSGLGGYILEPVSAIPISESGDTLEFNAISIEDAHIGISMPTSSSERWVKDGATMKGVLEGKGYEVDLQFAEDNISTQKSQIENMIDDGVDILIIAAIDGSTLTDPLEDAADAGITIIAYERLLANTENVDYYISFNMRAVGMLQAESLVEGLQKNDANGPYNVELFSGAAQDTNSNYFYLGAMDVLMPMINDGTIIVKSGQLSQEETSTMRWDSNIAKERMELILSTYYSSGDIVHGVLSPYDGLSRGIIEALSLNGYSMSNMPIITGQDAESASVRLIISGEQYSTVLRNSKELALTTVMMTESILTGNEPEINDISTYDNGNKIVPAFLQMPVIVTVENYQEVLIDSGYLSESDLN